MTKEKGGCKVGKKEPKGGCKEGKTKVVIGKIGSDKIYQDVSVKREKELMATIKKMKKEKKSKALIENATRQLKKVKAALAEKKAKPKAKPPPKKKGERKFTFEEAMKEIKSGRQSYFTASDRLTDEAWKKQTGNSSLMGLEDDAPRYKRIQKKLTKEYKTKFARMYDGAMGSPKDYTEKQWKLLWLNFMDDTAVKLGYMTETFRKKYGINLKPGDLN